MSLSLSPRPDLDHLKSEFLSRGAVSIRDFLKLSDARALASELASGNDWVEIFRAGEKVYEMPHRHFLDLPQTEQHKLREMVENAARSGLQYRYRSIRVEECPAARGRRGLVLDRFADLLNAPSTIAMLRAIVGHDAIGFADAQATDYRAGDFLTTHDDAVEGKNRQAAYVFGLTERWQADWGGLLLFEDGDRVEGFVPDFNVLRIFKVPRRHHVSYVAPWVEARRLSVTGWLRAGVPGDAVQTGS